VLTIYPEFPTLITGVHRERNWEMCQVFKQLLKLDVYRVDNSLYSAFTRQTGEPPGSTDADFPKGRSFAPALFKRRHFFRIIFSVTRLFRSCSQTTNRRKKRRQQKER